MKKLNKLLLIIILILVFAVFYPSTSLFFVRDDWGFLPHKIYSLKNFWEIFKPKGVWFYRPLSQEGYFMLGKTLFGFNAYFYHLVNVLLQVANTYLVYIISKKIFNRVKPLNQSGLLNQPDGLALLSASFYGLNSLHLFSVYWIAGIYQIITTLFMLLSFYFFILFLEKNAIRHTLYAIFAYIMALLSGEMAIFLPFLITIYIYLFESKQIKSKKFHLKKLFPFYLLLFAYLIFYFSNVSLPTQDYGRNFSYLSIFRTFVKYSLYPFFAGYDRSAIFTSLNILMIIRALVIVWSVAFIFLRKKLSGFGYQLSAFALLWFLITVSIFTTIPGHTFAYLTNIPSVGFSMLIGYSLALLLDRNKVRGLKEALIIGFILLNLFIVILARDVDPDLKWHKKYSDLGKSSFESITEIYKELPKSASVKVFYDDTDVLDAVYFGNMLKAIYAKQAPFVELIKGTQRIIKGEDDIVLTWKAGRFEKL